MGVKFTVDAGRVSVYIPALDADGATRPELIYQLVALRLVEADAGAWSMSVKDTVARYWVRVEQDGPSIERQAELAYEYAEQALRRAVKTSSDLNRHMLALSRTGRLHDVIQHEHNERGQVKQ